MRSADGAYALKFHTLLQVDSRWFLQNGALSDKADTFLLRRFRPSMDGTVLSFVNFRFTPDFAGGSVAVYDAFADIGPVPWLHLVAGKFKSPLGLERLQSDADLAFIERSLDQNLTPQRDVGAALWGEILGGFVVYHVGIYNGNPDEGATAGLPPNRRTPVVTICARGKRSLYGLLLLKARGYQNVKSVAGGMGAWVESGLPIQSGR